MRTRILASVLLMACAALPLQAVGSLEGYRPTFTMSIQTGRGDNVLAMYINERLVEKKAWKDDSLCTGDEVLTRLKSRLSDLAQVNLQELIFDEMAGFDGFPWKEHAKSFSEVRFVFNGKTIRRIDGNGETISQPEPCPDGTCNPTPQPDCVPTSTTVSSTCGPWVQAGTTSHSYTRPCIRGFDSCGNIIQGTQSCAVDVTHETQTCTLIVQTTWTPSRPGVVCPSPSQNTEITTNTRTTTSAPSCGGCN